jgi:hypothetical protein
MWPVSSRWLPALGASHQITTRVEVWHNGVLVGPIDISDGSVTVTAKNRVRRSLSLVVPERYFPSEPTDLLAPYGAELRVFCGIDYGSSSEEVPVFRGLVDTVDSRKRYDGQLTVTADDLMAGVNDKRFETPRAAPSTTAAAAIATLIIEAAPSGTTVVIDPRIVDAVIPEGLLWDRDRGQPIDDLATSIAAEVWFDPTGIPMLRKATTLSDPPAWTLADGVGGTVVNDARSVTRKGVYSVVVVVIERSDGSTPIQVSVADTDPSSATYVGGPFGRVPRFYKTPLPVDIEQATSVGLALLAKSTGLTRTRIVDCVPNPALEGGDRVDIDVAGVIEQHIADSFVLPLGPGSMSMTTRSAKPDPGDT